MAELGLLRRKFVDMAADWDIYGECLGIPRERIEAIKAMKRDGRKDVTRCMIDMLHYWESKRSNLTWRELHTAAKRMELNNLALDITNKHSSLEAKGLY